MLEWLKRHAWKACSRLKRLTGSNPVLSAKAIKDIMILKFDEMELSHLPAFKGGEKEFAANMFFDGTNRIFKGCLIPGASIGVHTHDDSCEVIFILSGNGRLYEKGSAADDLPEYKDVTAGDCLYCKKGQTHSLMNPETSESDLIFYAVVPKQ